MAASALELALTNRLADLERYWSSLDRWMNFWTALVVIGVAIELWVILWEYRDDRHEWGRGIVRPPNRPSTWLLFWNLTGTALVVGGVAGEFGAHFLAGKIETDIRNITAQQVSIARGEAARANLEAAQLRAAMADRLITQQQCEDIRHALKRFAGKFAVIRSYENDPEGERLLIQIKNCLESTIQLSDRRRDLGSTWANAGLLLGIHVNPGEWAERAFATALAKSLSDDGKLGVAPISELGSDGPVEILVGMKPLALAEQLQKEATATREQGPRAKLLAEAAPKLTRELAPFVGQRVGLYVCGQQGVTEQETLDTWGVIANILDSDTVAGVTGAKWKEVPTNLNWAANCGAAKGLGQGVIVFVSKRALKGTMEAATVLARGLAKTLPPSPNKMLSIQDPDFAKLNVDRGFQRRDSPWAAAALDPELVTVLIGEHP
jgi:hypothetical protein